jgi:hypothetical protein
MIKSVQKTSGYRLFIWLLLALCIAAIYLIVSQRGSDLIPFGDSAQYWAAGKLMFSGGNPYSPEQVIQLKQLAGKEDDLPENQIAMMLYPPWVIPFLLPFGLVDYPLMRLLWLIAHIIILVLSVNLLWKIYSGPDGKKFIIYLLLITFAPTFTLLIIGHITTIQLLGLVGFLYFIHGDDSHTPWGYFAAGASASLALLKPQLLYLFIFALLVWIILNRNWMMLIGGATMILFLSLIAVIMNPLVFFQYWDTFINYEVGTWATPTIGMILRLVIGIEYEWLQLFPILFGLACFFISWRKQGGKWDWIDELPLLLLVCVVTAPFAWTYDMIVLIIPVIAITIKLVEMRFNWTISLFFLSYLLINLLTLYLHSFLHDFWFLWYAPFLLVWYLVGKRTSNKRAQKSSGLKPDHTVSN